MSWFDMSPGPSGRPRKPHFPLTAVKFRAAQTDGLLVVRSSRVKLPAGGMMATVRAIIESLREGSFVQTLDQGGTPFDAYAIDREGEGWYFKFTVRESVVVISLHPLEHATRTVSGKVVKP